MEPYLDEKLGWMNIWIADGRAITLTIGIVVTIHRPDEARNLTRIRKVAHFAKSTCFLPSRTKKSRVWLS